MNKPPLRIGFSGHQHIGDEAATVFVAQSIRELLEKYQQQAQQQGRDVIVSSALAMGSDQLFVQTALELNILVEAVIPCAQYETIFPSVAAIDNYNRLLNHAHKVHRLPTVDCTDDSYLAAGQWIVNHSDLVLLVWNGLSPKGRGGTGDTASYARLLNRPYVHINIRQLTVRMYGDITTHLTTTATTAPKQEFVIAKDIVYQGPTLVVNQYRLRMPDGKEIVRDIVERPESVMVLPIGQPDIILMVEEYDLGAGVWQLKLPGGKVENASPDGIRRQAEIELCQEIGYRPGKLEKLLDFYSHPGYVAHKVHLFMAHDLEWDPLEMEAHEEIRVQTFTLKEALAATQLDYRCDPEAALAIWLYAGRLDTNFSGGS
jgi:hypothetical protein